MTNLGRLPRAKRKGVLFVDDERLATKYFESRFSPKFPVFIATSARQALELMESEGDRIGVVISDERMPECTGINLLSTIRRSHPQTVRILTTAYTEMDTVLEAINIGSVFAFVTKPWKLDDLETVLLDGLELHERQHLDAQVIGDRLDDLRGQIIDSHVDEIAQIATKLGHYVCNALCPVNFLLDQLIEGGIANEYPPDFLREVRGNVDELVQTLRGLERASTPSATASHEWVALRPALDTALIQTGVGRRERHHEVEIDFPADLPRVFGSLEELTKLFWFMFAEQTISLPRESVINVKARAVEGTSPSSAGVRIEFEDFVPLPPHVDADNLLYPFNLRGKNPRQLGVFLACCYMIIRRHGGTFAASAKPNEGVVYSFFLPYDYRLAGEPAADLRRRIVSA